MISLLVVNYRSAPLAIAAIGSARAATSQRLQVVVVDNSCDEAEAETLRPHADTLLVSVRNRGYAGAINDGRRACDAPVIVISNPDVTFAPGSLDALCEPLDRRTSVAGPALFWDDGHRWFLPPAELHTGTQMLGATMASRSRRLHDVRDRHRIRKRIAFWSLRDVTAVDAVSGAVMAIRSDAFDDAGGFDERFFLYFEENDFLRRVAAMHRRIVYVPSARCRHVYNQSAGASDEAPALYASSERRYLEKWNGPFAARTLERLRRPALAGVAIDRAGPVQVPDLDVVVEASPLASFDTAAGCFPEASPVDLPPEVWAAYRDAAVYLRVVRRRTGEVLATYRRRAGD